GVVQLTSEVDPLRVAQHIRANDGFGILAHPTRLGWAFSPKLWDTVHAVEVWNVGYDGKYLPAKDAVGRFHELRTNHPHLLAVASHDLHQPGGYYDVTVEMEVETLSRGAILARLHEGQYQIASRWFHCKSNGAVGRHEHAYLGLFGSNLMYARRLRRWLSRVSS
ncbi:MAG: hypothetical protein ACM3JB_14555, partial [Acidobacteriaceae bacterium]